MTKSDLVDRLAEKKKLAWQHAEFVVDAIFACMAESVRRGEGIELRGFGSFQVRSYKAYQGWNPKNQKAVQVAPKRLPHFKVSDKLTARIDGACRWSL